MSAVRECFMGFDSGFHIKSLYKCHLNFGAAFLALYIFISRDKLEINSQFTEKYELVSLNDSINFNLSSNAIVACFYRTSFWVGLHSIMN
jgi:hypothetical protein